MPKENTKSPIATGRKPRYKPDVKVQKFPRVIIPMPVLERVLRFIEKISKPYLNDN